MVEIIRHAVVVGFIGLAVYNIFSSKRKIYRLTKVVKNERSKLNVI